MLKNFLVTGAFALTATMSQAAPVTFFGEDLSGAGPNAIGAQTAFLNSLSGAGTEDFEDPTSLPDIEFAGSSGVINATLSGGGASIDSFAGSGRFATSGSRYVETDSGGDFSVSFSTGISAFGFFGTDVGDFGNSLVLRLTDTNANIVDLAVGNTVGASGNTDGALLYFGFVDTMASYTNVQFLNDPGGTDVFGFDDLTIGDVGQVTNPPVSTVPLPAAGWLMIAGFGSIAALRRRKRA